MEKDDLLTLQNAISGCSRGTTIVIANLRKYLALDPCIIKNILIQILSLNKKGKRILLYSHNSEFIFEDGNSREIIQDTYLQQVSLYKYFDYELKGLLLLLHNNPHFLVDYIKSAVDDNIEPDSNLSQIWMIEGIEPAVEDVLKFLRSDSSHRFYLEYKWEKALFMNIKNGIEKEKAKAFLKKRFNQNLGNRKYAEQIVLISKGIFNDLFDIFIREYIEYIETPDDFFQIDWLNLRSGISIYGENTTFGDIEAAKWDSLLSSLEGITSVKVYAIKARIKRNIISYQKQADEERARNQLWC